MSDIDDIESVAENSATESSEEESEGEEEKIDAEGAPEESKLYADIYVLPKEEYKTSNVLSAFEMTEIINIRSAQIAKTNICMVGMGNLDNAIEIAKRELMERKCPLVLQRLCGVVDEKLVYEYWNPNEMVFSLNWT